MVQVKVKIPRWAEAYFRKQARNSSNEILAYLIGTVVSPSNVRVDFFRYPDKLREQTPGCVWPTQAAENRIKEWAAKRKLIVVGTIHSHPNVDAVLSPHDHRGHITDCHRVSGVCSVQSRRTRVRYWVAESSLECDVEYSRAR